MKHDYKILLKIMYTFILLILVVISIPIANYMAFGKFTYSMNDAMEYSEERQKQSLDCEWGIVRTGFSHWECKGQPCKVYNIDNLDCIYKGMDRKALLYNYEEIYMCKDYGEIRKVCIEY